MVAADLKSETVSLMEQRDALEAEMNSIIARLSQPGGPGISGNLVDSEGFPRTDIDIPVVRADRHRLSVLRNDYDDITAKISEKLEILHSARLTPNPNQSTSPNSSAYGEGSDNQVPNPNNTIRSASPHGVLPKEESSVVTMGSHSSIPFAIVDEIGDASPAAEDGLQLGDQIMKFGNVESGDNLLPRLASESQSNQDQAIPVVILRHGAVINFTVTPRIWHGRGLLGCHFRIL